MTRGPYERDESNPDALIRLQRDPRDESAWRQFIERSSPPLLHYLFGLTRNPDLARDILQDVFLRFVEQNSFRTVKNLDSALALLRVMARHRFIDWFRSARAAKLAAVAESATALSAAVSPNSGETAAIFESEMMRLDSQLSGHEQKLLAMMLKGHELAAIADALNISYSSAAVRLFRLREKLRHLSDAGVQAEKL